MCKLFNVASLSCAPRISGDGFGTGGVSSELGRGLRHVHHAGDRLTAALSAGGLRPNLQDTGVYLSIQFHKLYSSLSGNYSWKA